MSQQIFTITGSNQTDLDKRVKAFEALQEQETIVLERLTELSEMPKAVKYLKEWLSFKLLKTWLNNK